MFMCMTTALSTLAIEAFLSGAVCGITLYCGKRTPIGKSCK